MSLGLWFLLFLVAFILMYFLSSREAQRWLYPTVEQMEAKGLIEAAVFRARRAFQVEEMEDEGLHYFLELDDGGVLFLSGQYLYDYEPIDDDEEVNQSRQFPCTEFVVKRHKADRHVVEIVPGGTPFAPEVLAPPFSEKDFLADAVPADGEIIRDVPYEQIKRERLSN